MYGAVVNDYRAQATHFTTQTGDHRFKDGDNMMKATVKVYMKYGGATFEYDIESTDSALLTAKAREHLAAIAQGGYRHCAEGILEWFPPHWIDKVKVTGGIGTSYPDRCSGT